MWPVVGRRLKPTEHWPKIELCADKKQMRLVVRVMTTGWCLSLSLPPIVSMSHHRSKLLGFLLYIFHIAQFADAVVPVAWLHGWNWRKMPMCDYCYYFYYLSFVYVYVCLDPCIVAFHPLFHDLQVFGRAQSVSGFLWPETPASSWDALQQEIVLKYYISYKRLLFIYKWNFSDKKKKQGGRHCQASSCSSFIYLFN